MSRPQQISHEGKRISFEVEVFLVPEGEQVVAICPALQLSTYGSSAEDAREAFADAMDIFLESTARKGTFEKVLLGLGWRLQQRPVVNYEPPRLTAAFLKKLGSAAAPFTTVNQRVAIPA